MQAMHTGFCGTGIGLRTQQRCQSLPRRQQLTIQARYHGQGTDLSKVPAFKRHEKDCGSSELQVAALSARVTQLTSHLQEHKKDYASRRGLMVILSRRKALMKYLYRWNRPAYDRLIRELGIRPLKVQAGRNLVIRLTESAVPERPDDASA